MLNKNSLGLLALGAVLIALGVFLTQQDSGDSEFTSNKFLPELAEQLDDLTMVEVIDAGNKLLVKVEKSTQGWTVSNLDGYPADTAKVGKLINELVDAKIIEKKTARADKHDRLGLAGIDSEDSKSTLIRLQSKDKTFAVLLGDYPTSTNGGGGRFVRLLDQDQTYEIDKKLYPPSAANSWIERKLFHDFNLTDVKRVERSAADNDLLVFKTDKSDKHYQMDSVPEGKKLKYDGVLDDLASSISGMRIDAPIKQDATLWQDKQTAHIKVELFNGASLILELLKQDDDYWLRASASGQDPVSKTLADKLNAELKPWQFKIAQYSYSGLVKQLSDYLDDIELEQEAPGSE